MGLDFTCKGVCIKTLRSLALFFGLFFAAIVVLAFLIYRANHNLYIEDAKNSVESVLGLTQELITHEKQLSLSIALMLSQNETIKQSYLQNDRALAYTTIHAEMQKIKQILNIEHLDIQLHTNNAHAWVRSWDFESYGEDLKPFRKGLATLRQTKLPFVSIELGKRLNIKALCPIFDKEDFIGSLEVIMGFDEIAAKLKEKKIDFFVLMDKELLEIGEWMKELEQINDFVIVSNSCGKECHDILNTLLNTKTLESGFARMDRLLFGFTPLFDIEAKRIGYIGIWFDTSLLKESLLLRSTLLPHSKSKPPLLFEQPPPHTTSQVIIR